MSKTQQKVIWQNVYKLLNLSGGQIDFSALFKKIFHMNSFFIIAVIYYLTACRWEDQIQSNSTEASTWSITKPDWISQQIWALFPRLGEWICFPQHSGCWPIVFLLVVELSSQLGPAFPPRGGHILSHVFYVTSLQQRWVKSLSKVLFLQLVFLPHYSDSWQRKFPALKRSCDLTAST